MKTAFASIATAVALSTPLASPPLSGSQVIQRSLESLGGEKALRSLENLAMEIQMSESGQQLIARYRSTRSGLMRIDVYVDGARVFSEGIDEKGSWEQAGEAAPIAVTTPDARNALTHGVDYLFSGIWLASERGNEAEWLGSQSVQGQDYQVVRLSFPDGFRTYFYINPDSWLIERQRDERAYHPSADSTRTTVEKIFSDWRSVCGVRLPFKQSDRDLRAEMKLSDSVIVLAHCNLPREKLEIGRPA